MKKLYKSQKHRRRNNRRSRRAVKRKNERRCKRRVAIRSGAVKREIRLVAPVNFSLIDNAVEALFFFEEFTKYGRRKHPVFLDMSEIREITPDAILYLLSLFDLLEEEHDFSQVKGNLPSHKPCRAVLLESGFLEQLKGRQLPRLRGRNILSIETGSQVRGDVAAKVISFAQSRLGRRATGQTSSVYKTIIECMANTTNHAYKDEAQGTWRLVASYDKEQNRVRFAFLDNGRGIPHTIRKNFHERLQTLFQYPPDDGKLIRSAIRGDFRTRTRKIWRGRGLPAIYSYCKKGEIADLVIVSNNAFVKSATDTDVLLKRKFHGTLLCWDFLR